MNPNKKNHKLKTYTCRHANKLLTCVANRTVVVRKVCGYECEQAISTKHRLCDGVILMLFGALQVLTSIQLQHSIYIKNANKINISGNHTENSFFFSPCISHKISYFLHICICYNQCMLKLPRDCHHISHKQSVFFFINKKSIYVSFSHILNVAFLFSSVLNQTFDTQNCESHRIH